MKQLRFFPFIILSVYAFNQTYLSEFSSFDWRNYYSNSLSIPWVRDRSGFCDSDFCFFTNCKSLETSDILEISFEVEKRFLECLVLINEDYLQWRTTLRNRGFHIKISNFTITVEGKTTDDHQKSLSNIIFSEDNPLTIESITEIHNENITGLKQFLENFEGRDDSQTFIFRCFIGLKCGYTDTEIFSNDWFFRFNESCLVNNDQTTESSSSSSSLPSETETSIHPNCFSSEGCSFDIECHDGEFCNQSTCICEQKTQQSDSIRDYYMRLSKLWFGLLFSCGSCTFLLTLCFCISTFSREKQERNMIQLTSFNDEYKTLLFDGKELFRETEIQQPSFSLDNEIIKKIEILNERHRSFFIKHLFKERLKIIPYVDNHENYGSVSNFLGKDEKTLNFSEEQRLYFCFCLLSCSRILRTDDIGILHTKLTPSSFFLFSDNGGDNRFRIKLFGSHIYGSLKKSLDSSTMDISDHERFHYYPPETNEDPGIYSRESENWVVGMTIWSLFNMNIPLEYIKDKDQYSILIQSGTRPNMKLFQSEIGIDKNSALIDMLHFNGNQRRSVEEIDLEWFI